MKLIRIFLFSLLLSLPAFAQIAQFTAPDCQFGFVYNVVAGTITSTTSASAQRLPLSQDSSGIVGYDNRNQTCTTWTLMYQTDSGVTPLSIEIDQAPSNGDVPGSWSVWANTAPGTVLPLTTATMGQASVFGYQPWISVNFNSATGTGRLYGRMLGWKPQAGQDVTSPGNAFVIAGFTYKHISTATSTQMKTTPGTLHTVTIGNNGTPGTVTVIDSSTNCSGGTTIAVVAALAATGATTLTFDAATVNGLCVVTAAATDVTVTYR
jgi:hypothetical protein